MGLIANGCLIIKIFGQLKLILHQISESKMVYFRKLLYKYKIVHSWSES